MRCSGDGELERDDGVESNSDELSRSQVDAAESSFEVHPKLDGGGVISYAVIADW